MIYSAYNLFDNYGNINSLSKQGTISFVQFTIAKYGYEKNKHFFALFKTTIQSFNDLLFFKNLGAQQ